MKNRKTLGELPENVLSALVILTSYIYFFGFAVSLFVLIKERDNEFVRFYAKQTLIFSFISLIKYILSENLSFIIGLNMLLNISFIILIFVTSYNAYINKKFTFKFIEKIMEKLEL